ncbi:GNAT family N-acetyltransferase [Streptomyces sp. NPDC014846]|uniref:GNAT family N-acetyltransferase n=1 Tax=Streptomyces sp. NPDC014846 TaxID=3364922 RepID=UPI0036FFE397
MRPQHAASRTLDAVGRLQCREYSGAAALDFLERAWPDLYEQDNAASAYQEPAWLLGWARHLPPSSQPLVLAAVDGQRPVAALALARETAPGARTRITPLAWPASEQIRPVGGRGEAVNVLLAHLPLLAATVVAADLPEDSLLTQHAHTWWGSSDAETHYATVPLPVNLAALSRSTRRDHTRRRRTLDRLGDRVAYHRTHGHSELQAAFQTLKTLHHQRNAPRLRTAGTADLALPWRKALSQCASVAFIATLTLDGRPVAAQLCLRRGPRVYSVLSAMDPACQELAAGHALLHLLCADLTADGCTALDLGRTTADPGQRAYKAAYGAVWTTTHTFTLPHPVEQHERVQQRSKKFSM